MPEVPTTPLRGSPGAWLRLLRVHQWSKNLLLLVPPLGAHRLSLEVLGPALLGVAAFSLAASSAYVVNDLVDLEADRDHPLKSRRPLAAREISPAAALAAATATLLAALALALTVRAAFAGALAAYWLVTLAYSARLKRVAVLDVLVLAGLYTLRILAGTLATDVPTSSWLFTLSIFLFLSLALVKRTSELRRMAAQDVPAPSSSRAEAAGTAAQRVTAPPPRASVANAGAAEGGCPGASGEYEGARTSTRPLISKSVGVRGELLEARGRGYSTGDVEVLSMLGVASGLVAVLVLALYVASADVTRLYPHHERLWLLCPLALYWVCRLWLLTRRGAVDEDPVLFALRDPPSWLVGALAVAVMVAGS